MTSLGTRCVPEQAKILWHATTVACVALHAGMASCSARGLPSRMPAEIPDAVLTVY